jgi:hypothetical protein
MPVIGCYEIDDEDALVLITEYPSMSSYERFWFPAPNVRMRASTVKRFGGFSTATFCTEELMDETNSTEMSEDVGSVTQPAIATVFGW